MKNTYTREYAEIIGANVEGSLELLAVRDESPASLIQRYLLFRQVAKYSLEVTLRCSDISLNHVCWLDCIWPRGKLPRFYRLLSISALRKIKKYALSTIDLPVEARG